MMDGNIKFLYPGGAYILKQDGNTAYMKVLGCIHAI